MASRTALRLASRLSRSLFKFESPIQSGTMFFEPRLPLIASPTLNSFNFPANPVLLGNGVRFLATLRRQPVRPRTVDIGARARQIQNRRLWSYTLAFRGVAALFIIVLSNFQDQLVFYVTPTEALEKFAANPSKTKFRLGGLILEGSVVFPAGSPDIEFVITDLVTDILVRYQGALPDLFREGHSAVVEGFVRPFDSEHGKVVPSGSPASEKARNSECYFSAIEVLAKHDEKYMPKEVAAAIEKNKAKVEAAHSSLADSEEKTN